MSTEREAELLKIIQQKDEEIARLRQENALLHQKVDLLIKRIFGSGSEKLDPKQLELLLGGAERGKECASFEKKEAMLNENSQRMEARLRRERASRLPEHLPCVRKSSSRFPCKPLRRSGVSLARK